MNAFLLIGLTLSSSLDNFGVGISYGIRKKQIGFVSNFVIAVICFIFSYVGVCFGQWISMLIPGVIPERIGAFFLLIIGFRIIWLAVPSSQTEPQNIENNLPAPSEILQKPEPADRDKSNDIGFCESIILGIVLSTNALTNGISAGLFGLPPIILSLAAAVGSFLALGFGLWVGDQAADIHIGSFSMGQFGTFVSGIILVIMAVKIFI